MTAIALLNAQTDPHLVSDAMLSRHSSQPFENRSIWVPARGTISAIQRTGCNGWMISAFMRKTIYLPKNGGIIAWAGDLPKAKKFLEHLWVHYNNQCAYGVDQCISKKDIQEAFERTERDCSWQGDLTIVCCITDGSYTNSFILPNRDPIETVNFGECYCVGSGESCLSEVILRADKYPKIHLVPTVFRTLTECLAQRISSDMLFLDSIPPLPDAVAVPFEKYSGGFFEWHSVRTDGVRPAPPHVDLNIRLEETGAVVTRLYLSQTMSIPDENGDNQSVKSVMSFVTKDICVDKKDLEREYVSLSFSCAHGMILHQALIEQKIFTNTDSASSRNISGPLDTSLLLSFFQEKLIIFSVASIFIANGEAHARFYRHSSLKSGSSLVTFEIESGILSVHLNRSVLTL